MSPNNLKDIHAGETGLIVANGPSLADVPPAFLEKYPSMGMNRIYLPINGYRFQPWYYCILGYDQLDAEEKRAVYRDVIKNARAAFVNREFAHMFEGNVYPISGRDESGRRQGHKFSFEPLRRVGVGFTNTYVAMQLMYYLGFKTVLIVGLDNDYTAAAQKHYYPDAPDLVAESPHGDEGFQEGSNYVFHLARQAYEASGRRLINLTPTDKTPTLKMGRLEQWL